MNGSLITPITIEYKLLPKRSKEYGDIGKENKKKTAVNNNILKFSQKNALIIDGLLDGDSSKLKLVI